MGRSSKPDQTAKETTALNEQSSTTAFPFTQVQKSTDNRAVTESESMARDIKEGRLSGFVGAGTVLTGETTFKSMLRVDGLLTGRVSSEEGTLIIGSTGQVDADINVSAAIINGLVNGDITTSEKLELGRTARVVGNIKAPRLVMEDGAILEGRRAKEAVCDQ
jgi:cytoskeletal protein CcmA (bactofilin family)